MFNHVAPYRHLLPTMYLSVADIANPEFFVACGYRTWISLDIACFYEEQCQPSSGSAWPDYPKNGKSGKQFALAFCENRYNSFTACMLYRLEPICSLHS